VQGLNDVDEYGELNKKLFMMQSLGLIEKLAYKIAYFSFCSSAIMTIPLTN